MKILAIRFFGLLALAMFGGYAAMAQFEIRPNYFPEKERSSLRNLRTAEELPEPVLLPFWDDFSHYEGIPDTSLWMDSDDVLINYTMGIRPPTIGVATFDGMRGNGRPYSSNELASGEADRLLSKPINLSLEAVPAEKRGTVYLSFFYQIMGRGEIPNEDEDDRLVLQFKDEEGEWEDIWVTQDYNLLKVDSFYQVIMPIPEKYFFDNFQFKFQSYGRLAGAFDTWNLDYVYLNENRTADDLYYLDRAFSTAPSSLFETYTAVPKKHFFNNHQKYLGTTTTEIYNMDRFFQPVSYRVELVDTTSVEKQPFTIKEGEYFFPRGQYRSQLDAAFTDISKLNPAADSIYLKSIFILHSGDRRLVNYNLTVPGDTAYYENVDFRVNDTTSTMNILHNFYAYDDGSAEFNAGISQSFGKLAYEYIVGEEDTLRAIQIHFPGLSPAPEGRTIEVTVWKRLKDTELVLSRRASIIQGTGLNQFFTYEIDPVIVEDTIYIGWTQSSEGYLGVGFDKNTDSGNKIWYNISGVWEQSLNPPVGSLMIRPVFGRGEITTSVDEGPKPALPSEKLVIFPNPSHDKFYIKGFFNNIKIYDLRGVEIKVPFTLPVGGEGFVDMAGHKPGVYIIHIQTPERVYQEKIILRN